MLSERWLNNGGLALALVKHMVFYARTHAHTHTRTPVNTAAGAREVMADRL